MPLQNIWSYVRGYVIIKIKGLEVEWFLREATERGLVLWNIKRVQMGFFLASMRAEDFSLIRPVARLTGCKVEIWRKRGLPFWGRRLLRRPALIAGICILFSLIFVLSGRVWVVRIEGIETLDKEYIEQSVYDLGLVAGIKKSYIDTEEFENSMLLRIPELAWVGVRIQGSVAIVEVVEKVIAVKDVPYGDLVAAKPGLIHNLIVLSGEAVVKPGDTVVPGDCLIRGMEKDGEYISPRGIVEARVWYEGTGKVFLQDAIQSPTGRQKICYYVKMGDGQWRIWPIFMPFKTFRARDTKPIWQWQLGWIQVEVLAKTCDEMAEAIQSYTLDEARKIAVASATGAVLGMLSQNVEIVKESVEVTEFEQDGKRGVQAKVVIEVIEEIGMYDAGGVSLN